MKIVILIPVYNDWTALNMLLQEIENEYRSSVEEVQYVIVNDASTELHKADIFKTYKHFHIINLKSNLGHQKAIATGLCWIKDHLETDKVIVMDSDGEDKPEDISALLQKSNEHKSSIIFAKRKKRQEGFAFRLFYLLYKFSFWLLTGKRISFGNYCVIPSTFFGQICNLPALWLHFSGAILKSKLPIKTLHLDRGKRLAGDSKMNLTNLIMHGISAIAVYLETVSVRLLMFSFSIIFTAVSGIAIVTILKVGTNWAIPGWASNIFLSFVLIFLQAFFISLMLTFVVLYQRTQKVFLPSEHYQDFILNVEFS